MNLSEAYLCLDCSNVGSDSRRCDKCASSAVTSLQKFLDRKGVRKVRSKPRRGEPTNAEKVDIRAQVYAETGGRCEINKHPQCIRGRVWPEFGTDPWDHWHLVHIQAKRIGGWDRSNLLGGCPNCHLVSLHVEGGNGKIVPAKAAGPRELVIGGEVVLMSPYAVMGPEFL